MTASERGSVVLARISSFVQTPSGPTGTRTSFGIVLLEPVAMIAASNVWRSLPSSISFIADKTRLAVDDLEILLLQDLRSLPLDRRGTARSRDLSRPRFARDTPPVFAASPPASHAASRDAWRRSVRRSAFDGMQPRSMQSEDFAPRLPMNKRTRAPISQAVRAAVSPAEPPPRTATVLQLFHAD